MVGGGTATATAGGAACGACALGEGEASEAGSSLVVRACARAATGSAAARFALAETGLVGAAGRAGGSRREVPHHVDARQQDDGNDPYCPTSR
jgi:hypothetical protein